MRKAKERYITNSNKIDAIVLRFRRSKVRNPFYTFYN